MKLEIWGKLQRCLSLSIILSITLFGASHAATNVVDNITTDTTWRLVNSPYVVRETVEVNRDAILTIRPGVTVKFGRGSLLRVAGGLIAKGTQAQIITFTSNKLNAQAGSWGPIEFVEGAVGSTLGEDGEYVSGSIIEHCLVEYGNGIESSVGLYIANSSLSNNSFGVQLFLSGEGLIPSSHENITTIVGNTIQGNVEGGISIEGSLPLEEEGHVLISGNSIRNNGGDGISLSSFNITYTISENTITQNDNAIWAGTCEYFTCSITGNTLTHNKGGIVIGNYYFSGPLGTPHSITISNNNIEDNDKGIDVFLIIEDALCNITVTRNNIANNSEAGVSIKVDNDTFCHIGENIITGNGDFGVQIGSIFPHPPFYNGPYNVYINGNIITDNSDGIEFLYERFGHSFTVRSNTISNNLEHGIIIWGFEDLVTNTVIENNLQGNGQYAVVGGDTRVSIVAINNWWGTTDVSEIEEMVLDHNDNSDYGKVILEPVAQTPFPTPEPPLIAAFSAIPLAGTAPLSVQFTDESFGSIDSWLWDFGTEIATNEQNPTYTFTYPGTFAVSLTVSNEYLSDTETKTAYITVLGCEDYNRDGVVDIGDLLDRREDLVQEWETWKETCWSPKESCGDYNEDGVVDLRDWRRKRVSLCRQFRSWIRECWPAEMRNHTDMEIAEELMREFSGQLGDMK